MSDTDDDRTASLMTPAKLAQLKVRPAPVASPAAWLDQMAADAGSGHVRRLMELRAQLEAQVRERSYHGVTAALGTLGDALARLDFALVQPKGWLARATGKSKEAAAGFVSQYERILRDGEDLADELRSLQKKQQAQAAATDRTLLECEVELKAIEKIMDQGARWLQDMRNQLKTREAQGGDAAEQKQIADDARRCELLVGRLKQLRAASTASAQCLERCRSTARSRASLLESLQQALDGEWKSWEERVGPLAEQVRESGSADAGLDRARTATDTLQSTLKQARQDCRGLAGQESTLAEDLVGLQVPLREAA
jgi:chromosome segregation ATPase